MIQERRLAMLNEESSVVRRDYYAFVDLQESIETTNSELAALKEQLNMAKASMFSTYMLTLLQDERHMSLSEIEEFIKKQEAALRELQAEVNRVPRRRLELEENASRIDAKRHHCERRIGQLRKDAGLGIILCNYDSRDIVYGAGKISERAILEDPNLVLMLQERIYASDVVIVIAETFAQYRLWMDCELSLARDLHRPIVAVIPPGQRDCPRDVRTQAAAIADWNPIAIGKVLLQYAKDKSTGA
jgi:hypothetical protein